jgi:hypothetical protein
MSKFKVSFTDKEGNNRKYITTTNGMWLTFGNFSGMGEFKKLKIVEIK